MAMFIRVSAAGWRYDKNLKSSMSKWNWHIGKEGPQEDKET
jgi:hypothetical protein